MKAVSSVPILPYYHSHRSYIFHGPTFSDTLTLLRGVSIKWCCLTSIRIPMLKIRLLQDRLIFNMGIPIPGKTVFILRLAPDAESGICWDNYANTIAADALAPCITKPLTTMVSTMQDKETLRLPKGRISTTCAISVLRNDRKCKYIFYVS